MAQTPAALLIPGGIPIVTQESVHGPVVFWPSIHPLSGLPEPTDNTHRQCVLSVFGQTGHWMDSWPKQNRFMEGFLGNNWSACWGAQKWGRFLGHKKADRKWSQTVCDQILSANFGSIKWPQKRAPKITFLSDSMSPCLRKAFRLQE